MVKLSFQIKCMLFSLNTRIDGVHCWAMKYQHVFVPPAAHAKAAKRTHLGLKCEMLLTLLGHVHIKAHTASMVEQYRK